MGSGQTNAGFYMEFIEAKKRGFNQRREYKLANVLGDMNYEKFNEFQSSKFWTSSNYEEYPERMVRAYKEFQLFKMKEKQAHDLGFKSLEDYRKAKELEIIDANIYSEFLQSNCETKEEFEFFKNMPRILEKKIKKIDEIVNDAEKVYNSERFEEFIRLKFLSIEKISEALYFKTFRQETETDDDLKVDDKKSKKPKKY